MREAFVERLSELAERSPRIFLITGDLGYGVLTQYSKRFPNQFLNVGVAEQNLTGIATGLALEGRIVFTYSIANFPTLRCLEQIRNDSCYHGADVKIIAIGGGFSYGALGISHHATEDLSILRALPDIILVAPGDKWEAQEATSALVDTPGTCYLRIDKSNAAGNKKDEVFQLGHARKIREGKDLTLISTGGILGEVIKAGEELSQMGIETRVLSMHTVKPLDRGAVLDSCQQTGGIVTVEEHTIFGGLGSAVAEACMDAGVLPKRFLRIGLKDGFSSIVGTQEYLRCRYGLDKRKIYESVVHLLS